MNINFTVTSSEDFNKKIRSFVLRIISQYAVEQINAQHTKELTKAIKRIIDTYKGKKPTEILLRDIKAEMKNGIENILD